jgi:hypothetical protein
VEGDCVGARLASRSLGAVIDTIGGDALESTCEALRPNGIIVFVVRAPDEGYLRSKGLRARLISLSTSRATGSTESRLWSNAERSTCRSARPPTASSIDGAPHKPGKIWLKVADGFVRK